MKKINRVVALAVAALAIASTSLLVLVATPASAACPPGTVNGGNSEIDQYQEAIPGSCGNRTPGGDAGGGGGSGNVPADTVDDLNSLGDDGVATAGLASAGAPRIEGRGGGSPSAEGAADGSFRAVESDGDPLLPKAGSPLSAVLKVVSGDSSGGGLKLFLPLVLGGTLLAALAGVAIARRRPV